MDSLLSGSMHLRAHGATSLPGLRCCSAYHWRGEEVVRIISQFDGNTNRTGVTTAEEIDADWRSDAGLRALIAA
jgi:hypothetical protein